MSISKALRVLAVALVAAFIPATALAAPTTAGTQVVAQQEGARIVRSKNVKLKAGKADKAGKATRVSKVKRSKIVRRAAH